MLIDAAEHAARQVHDGAEDAGDIAYLVGRGVLSDTVCTLPAEGSLSTGDTFLVLGVVPLADVQAFLHRALEALA